MRKTLLVLATIALAVVAVPSALAKSAAKTPPPKVTTVKLLAFNDFHGHLEANTPGTIQTGCCVPNPATGAPQAIAVPAGGAEYFATHMKALGSDNGIFGGSADTYVVGAGDMIGGTPLLSGLFHDEPTIEFLNLIGVDTVGVGNHEFDEGKSELLRMQYGNRTHSGGGVNTGTAYAPFRPDGCHPVDGCQDGTPFYGSVFQYLAANVIDTSTGNPLLPAYQIKTTSTNEKIAFIGETLEGTPLVVTPSGVAGLDFLDEANTVNALVPILKQRGVETMVLLLHQGGFQNPPPASQGGFLNVDACQNFAGPDLLDVVNRLDPEIDVVVSAHTHAPYICTINNRLVTSAASFGRRHHRDRPHDRPAHGRCRLDERRQPDRDPERREGSGDDGAAGAVQAARRSDLESRHRDDHGRLAVGTRHPERPGRLGRAADGERDRGRPARSDEGERFRRLRGRVHEPGRRPGRSLHQPDQRR